ncbi:MAG: hypothetical protein A3F84_25970 [Candidatus Handelsmanbacteria bacterium RIFCSPLOWO2_12_FULL_64_10]|uniref:Uncharacterized protein n=1 Tax=Handelsmanbacteria sp. (strain RIFCSPLOWO2_12_FULL_64_10) TaxID=1817868 RepID=A0A1F6D0C7_HANXR|nr:MAG: hypothetical protein A3F84_25970 [Candidatus Handelsmanbacteria bacterium RIFCSPLOWO2_12_FULL_64_10]
MSEKRVRLLVADLADEAGESVDAEWKCSEALDHGERWVHELSGSRRAKREQAIASIKEQDRLLSARIDSIRAARQREAVNKTDAANIDRQLAELCDGARLDKLEARLEVALALLDREAQFARARKAVAPLLGPDVRACPICGLASDGAELLTRVTEGLEEGNTAHEQTAQEVQVLEQRKEQAQRLATQRDTASQDAESARRECEQLVAQMTEELGCSSDAWECSAEARLTELRGRLNDLQQEGTSATEHSARHLQRIKALREEWRYHQLRDEEQRLRREFQEGLQAARDRLRALEDFRSVVVGLHEVLCEEFDAAVDRALPLVSSQLTEAFRRLTDHPAFDVLRVERAQGPDQLVVQVGSTRARVPWSRPEDVLNGGAYAALGLIPHFVFSGFHAEQAELNVLIVDDPSQSFDTTHVELLLEELHRAGEHAQLLLATHEEERFRPIVKRLFRPDSFTIIRVTDFRPDRGPTVEHR